MNDEAMFDQRGFRVFHETPLTDESARLLVKESSLAFEGPHVRVYGGRSETDHVHLSLAQARAARAALAAFVIAAESGELTEKAMTAAVSFPSTETRP